MTPSEILRKAKALIDMPEKLTKGCFARDMQGNDVDIASPAACAFCSIGATQKTVRTEAARESALKYLRSAMLYDIVGFNDTHTHAEVMAKWDEAIALAEADEKEVCDTCNGTGVQCFEKSGLTEDGNAPILEPCGMCGYGNENESV